MLLEHCYSTNSTFPVCFVPDSEITRISVYTASDECRENDKSDRIFFFFLGGGEEGESTCAGLMLIGWRAANMSSTSSGEQRP